MYIFFSLNYLLFRFVLRIFNPNHNIANIHKLSSYINTYIFSFLVVTLILTIHFNNNEFDEFDKFDNYVYLLDLFRDYFIYDIVNMTVFSNFKRNIPFYIHHSLFLISYIYYYEYLLDFRLHMIKILFCEITQFFLINCWVLHKFTNYNKLLKINGILLLFTFFIFRVVNFIYHTFIAFHILPESIFYTSYLMVILTSLNIYWFYLLFKMFQNV